MERGYHMKALALGGVGDRRVVIGWGAPVDTDVTLVMFERLSHGGFAQLERNSDRVLGPQDQHNHPTAPEVGVGNARSERRPCHETEAARRTRPEADFGTGHHAFR